jgi:hypothetical protein
VRWNRQKVVPLGQLFAGHGRPFHWHTKVPSLPASGGSSAVLGALLAGSTVVACL